MCFEYESRDESGQWWRTPLRPQLATRLRIVAGTGQKPEIETTLV